MQVVLAAAVLGAGAVALCIVGAGLLRGSRGRRRTAQRRIADLERENAALKQRRVSEPDEGAHSDDRPVVVESQR
jgi:cell division protein FtsB